MMSQILRLPSQRQQLSSSNEVSYGKVRRFQGDICRRTGAVNSWFDGLRCCFSYAGSRLVVRGCGIGSLLALSIFSARLLAGELELKALQNTPQVISVFAGVTRTGTPIPAFITPADLDVDIQKTRVLLVGGLDGSPDTAKAAISVMHRFYNEPKFEPLRKAIALSIIPCGNPDGLARNLRNDNGSGGDPARGYPPPSEAYTSANNPEVQYIWRWIGMHAPDTVIELTDGKANQKVDFLSPSARPADSLAAQLSSVAACQVGIIPSHNMAIPVGNVTPFEDIAKDLMRELNDPSFHVENVEYSPARLEMQARNKRSPLEVCDQLAKVYGRELPSIAYIPAVACIGRLRLAGLTKDSSGVKDIEQLTAEYLNGSKPTLDEKSGGSEIAGHILWGELYDATNNPAYIKLALVAADRAFTSEGKPRDAMPTHNEMSDAVFMGCPILAQVGRLTGERKYHDMCMTHMRYMLKLNLRTDGLHRHSPLDETAWGRGNGFPALGIALALEDMPADYPARSEMLDAFRQHLTALLPHQDPTGAWHQVIDHPESYREMTSTCMITYAMARGVRRGWLPEQKFVAATERGWTAIKARNASDGSLVDVCTGTGKQKSLRDYLDRPAILGRDLRGGAMALLVATEIEAWQRE